MRWVEKKTELEQELRKATTGGSGINFEQIKGFLRIVFQIMGQAIRQMVQGMRQVFREAQRK